MKNKRRGVLLLSGIFMLVVPFAHALDYFGDFERNHFVIELEPRTEIKNESPFHIHFPIYMVLRSGQVFLSDSEVVKGKAWRESRGSLQIINKGKQGDLKFMLYGGGWWKDHYETIVQIPFTIQEGDEKGTLRMAKDCFLERRWHDPLNDSVTVISDDVPPLELLKCTVLESTLGFNNKLGFERTGLLGNENSAWNTLKRIGQACERMMTVRHVYPSDLNEMEDPFLQDVSTTGVRDGYKFNYKQGQDGKTFTCEASPVTKGVSGNKRFILDDSGLIQTLG